MCLLVIKGFALLLLCISCHAAPLADNVRKALVIGNDAYVTSRLKNAVNDAEDMARVLRGLGFGVTVITNATGAGMEEAVSVFIGHLSPGDRVVVFYAGHGVQDGVENYMIPIDFTPTAVRQIRMQAYPLSRLQHLLSHAAPSLQVMIFDACRDNPFHEQLSLKRGWRMVDNTTANSYIAFSTAPGSLARDDSGRGRNGLFTSYLLDALRLPGLTIDQIFNAVRSAVYAASETEQLPWTSSSLLEDMYLIAPPTKSGVRPDPLPRASGAVQDGRDRLASVRQARRSVPGCLQSVQDVGSASRATAATTRHDIIPEPEMLWDDKIAQPSNTEQQLQAVVSTITRPCGGLEYVLIRPGVSRAGCAASGECGNQTRDLLNGEPFWMGKTEVTVKEYLDVMSSSGLPIPVPPSFNDQWHLKSHPMVNVALAEAARFCALTGGRLPFNKEWDIAAATGGLNNVPVSRDSANYGNEACCSGFIGGRDKWEYTAPVGSFPPNSFGLYDMLGNVWEWVLPEQARAVNRTGETAFLRGGSWLDRAWYLSSSYRRSASGTALRTVGFRCVFNDHGDDRQTSGVAPGGSHRERR